MSLHIANDNHHTKEDWLTPPELLQALGAFDLDPCASTHQPWRTAETQYTVHDNGLAKPWFGRVWMNPPYGRQTGKWMERLAHHGNGIALIFARTETLYFAEHVWPRADGLLFLEGRIRFCTPDGRQASGSGGAPSVLIAYGADNAARLRGCSLQGAYVDNWRNIGDPRGRGLL